ncbi:MAG TPA: 50S ribosomal protein L11 methyltransferase [Cytophagaceae bacterium]|nr:50S ribosomal protein L11 methyltransferase [Cytophagaceae bacterium]
MQPKYLVVPITCKEEDIDLLVYHLTENGFEAFEEKPGLLEAYILIPDYNKELVHQLVHRYFPDSSILEEKELENKNWNEEWEKNFDPITVNKHLRVRAIFHEPDPEIEMELVIQPKMSFGTGHHGTTRLMMEEILDLSLEGLNVIDAGCGTGILGILTEKRGAKSVLAYDIEDWAFQNSVENTNLNSCERVKVLQGTIGTLVIADQSAEIVLANINRNILLEEMGEYARVLKKKGTLLLSGFYEEDIAVLTQKAREFGLQVTDTKLKDKWALMKCEKV